MTKLSVGFVTVGLQELHWEVDVEDSSQWEAFL